METKQEFIDGLRRALTGRISQEEIEGHIRYYEDYITAETRIKGTEQEVLNALGNPKLIAMSICAADEAGMHGKGGNKTSNTGYSDEYAYGNGNGYNGAGDYGYDDNSNDEYHNSRTKDERPFIFRHPKLTIAMIILGILVVIVLVIALAFSLLKLLWPVIVVSILVILIVRLMAYFANR
mgnify:CR=1 FL=1